MLLFHLSFRWIVLSVVAFHSTEPFVLVCRCIQSKITKFVPKWASILNYVSISAYVKFIR
jgi:hypothetical protein